MKVSYFEPDMSNPALENQGTHDGARNSLRPKPRPRGHLWRERLDYRATAATLDIPFPDAETIHSDQATKLMVVGTTADRPVNITGRINWPPREMYDTTLGAPIFLVPGSNPPRWVNIAGSAA